MKFIFRLKYYLLLVFLLVVSLELSISNGVSILKPLNAFLYFSLVIYSIIYIKKYNNLFKKPKIFFIFLFFNVYILIKLFIDFLDTFSFKSFTEIFILRYQYYSLSILALPFAIYLKNKKSFFSLYTKQFKYIGFICLLLIFSIIDIYDIGVAYFLIASLVLPLSLLVFSDQKSYKIIGFIFCVLGLVYVSLVASRSYFLVFLYILLIATIRYFKSKSRFKFFKIIFVLILGYILINASLLVNKFSNSPIYEKFKIGSIENLLNGTNSSFSDYEGDSRSVMINDAFKNFVLEDFLFGKGINYQYESFIKRNTIEIGILQEAFWFGFIFVFFSSYFLIESSIKLLKEKNNELSSFFGIVILIRVLDSFVYGMPEISIYTFLAFVGLYLPYVKKI